MGFNISDARETRFRTEPPRRVCSGSLSSTLGKEILFYAVDWQQKENNIMQVRILGNKDDGL